MLPNTDTKCDKCGGKLFHTGWQKICYPPIDIYKCINCGNEVHIKQKSNLFNQNTDVQPE